MPSTKTPRTPSSKPAPSNRSWSSRPSATDAEINAKRIAAYLANGYENLSKEYPTTKYVLDSLPITGQVTSGLDTADSMYRGNYGAAAVDALGILPGGGLAKKIRATYKGLKKAPVKELELLKKGLNNVQQLDRVGDAKTFYENAEPMTERNYAKGGHVKSRGNGIAKRGLTKGRMR